jgi:uncharacterized protein (DUF433 family)
LAEARFYLDEHVPQAVPEGLRRRGVDILTVQESGLAGAEDERHLTFAPQEGRVIVTQDVDFLRFFKPVAGGKPRIAGYRITVQDIVIWHERLNVSADEFASEYGLPLADVYAALA